MLPPTIQDAINIATGKDKPKVATTVITPEKPITLDDLKPKALNKNTLPYRSTMTARNARMFQEMFDSIIASEFTQEHYIYYATLPHLAPATIYVKLCDALSYLVWEQEAQGKTDTGYHKLNELYEFSRRKFKDRIHVRRKVHYTGEETDVTSITTEVATILQPLNTPVVEPESKPNKLPIKPVEQKIEDFRNKIEEYFNATNNFDINVTLEMRQTVKDIDKEWMDNLFAGVSDVISVEYVWAGEKTLVLRKSKVTS